MRREFQMDDTICECINERRDFVKLTQPFGEDVLVGVLYGASAWEWTEHNLMGNDYLCGCTCGDDYYINAVGQYLVRIPDGLTTASLPGYLEQMGIEVVGA